MSKFKFAIHLLIILSVLSAGVASSHVCLDSHAENSISAISLADNSSSNIAFSCCESSCYHNCNHLFSLNSNLNSEFSSPIEKNLVDSYSYFITLNYLSLPSKPPKA